MRPLYLTISLLLASSLTHADKKIDAIADVKLTPCFTTRVIFNDEALKAYQGTDLSLKIEDETSEEVLTEKLIAKDGRFFWEKALPVSENLTFTVMQAANAIAYPFIKETRNQLTKMITPPQLAQSDEQTSGIDRALSANNAKKEIPIRIADNLRNKELLVILISNDGKSLWQYTGTVDSNVLNANVPEANYGAPVIIPTNTLCTQ